MGLKQKMEEKAFCPLIDIVRYKTVEGREEKVIDSSTPCLSRKWKCETCDIRNQHLTVKLSEVLGLLDDATRQIQEEALNGEGIRFAIESLDKACEWKAKHNIQNMKFISVPRLLVLLVGEEAKKNLEERKCDTCKRLGKPECSRRMDRSCWEETKTT